MHSIEATEITRVVDWKSTKPYSLVFRTHWFELFLASSRNFLEREATRWKSQITHQWVTIEKVYQIFLLSHSQRYFQLVLWWNKFIIQHVSVIVSYSTRKWCNISISLRGSSWRIDTVSKRVKRCQYQWGNWFHSWVKHRTWIITSVLKLL